MASCGESGSPAVPAAELPSGGLVRESLKPQPPPPLVLSDRSPIGGGLRHTLFQPWTGLSLYTFPPIPLLAELGMRFHADLKTLRLTVWTLSGIPSRVRAFHRRLSKRSSLPLDTQLEQVYKGRWESFVSWCDERGENPIRASMKHVLDFLQAKSETRTVNTIKRYVTTEYGPYT